MPCSEIADRIVQTAREILERAIALIYSVDKVKAEVVYGDTDSFSCTSRTDQGTRRSRSVKKSPKPSPRLTPTFEKIYYPCILLAKKRHVGFKYELPD